MLFRTRVGITHDGLGDTANPQRNGSHNTSFGRAAGIVSGDYLSLWVGSGQSAISEKFKNADVPADRGLYRAKRQIFPKIAGFSGIYI